MTLTRRTATRLLAGVPVLLPQARGESTSAAERMGRYNVVWNSPSKDATGVMPIGNGDIAAGVYAIENGDLYLLLSKNDAYTYMGDIFKTGRVRVSLNPNPFQPGRAFRQTLDLQSGSILIEADGVTLRIWADANRPVFHVEINSPRQIAVTAQPEFWKRFDTCAYNVTDYYSKSSLLPPGVEPAQDVRLERDGKLLWYYPVGDRSVYPDDLKFYQVEHMAEKFPDPYRYNTFGNLLESPALQLKDGVLRGAGKRFDIRIHALALQARKPETWIQAIERQAAASLNAATDWEKHRAWWASFWERSWIMTSDRTLPANVREKLNGEPSKTGLREERDGAALVAQSYNVFRFLMANCPIIQTVANPGQTGHPWGSEFFSKQRIVAEIDYHRVKTPLEPAIEGVQVTPARPRRGHTVPAVQLLLKNLAAHLFQTLADLFLVLGFRKQVDRRFSPEIFQAQSATRGIRPMQPIQEWLARHHHDRGSVEGGYAVSA